MKLNPFKKSITKEQLIADMTEKRALPQGRKEFEEWSDRIIKSAMVMADAKSQKYALADMILHLGATEDFKEDAYFIKHLRKVAVNQVADAVRTEIYAGKKDAAELEAKEKSKAIAGRIKAPFNKGYYEKGEYFEVTEGASNWSEVQKAPTDRKSVV